MKEFLEGNKILFVIGSFALLMAMVLIGVQFAGSQSVIVEPTKDGISDDNAHGGSFVEFNTKATITTIEGDVTEVFTDCVERKVLDEDGEVTTSADPITCDGGSYIRIDDALISTSSGNAPQEFAFNKHKATLNPGTAVTVTAITTDQENTYNLNCSECTITIAATPPSDDTQVVTGAVTEVFTDCVERKTLNEAGEVTASTDGITCDGGSYIIVNDTRITTASGLVPATQAFSKHKADLDPGSQVVVRAQQAGTDTETLTLNCDDCSLETLKLPAEQ